MKYAETYKSKPVRIKLRGSGDELEGNFIFTKETDTHSLFHRPVTELLFVPKNEPATEKSIDFWHLDIVHYL